MSALLQSLAEGFDTLPLREAQGLADSRRDAWQAAMKSGLPNTRMERWKYTALRALEQRRFVLPNRTDAASVPDVDLPDVELPDGHRLVFVDGVFDAARSALDDLPDGVSLRPLSEVLRSGEARELNVLGRRWLDADAGFWHLNAALATEGAWLHIESGVVLQVPLHLLFVSTKQELDLGVHLRNRIEVCEGARASVVEHHRGSAGERPLINALTHIHLRRGAELEHVRVQQSAPGASLIARSEAVLAQAAKYRMRSLELGSALSRHELAIDLQGREARAEVRGLVRSRERQHIDTRMELRHQSPQASSDTQWRAIAGGRSRVVFHGGIEIVQGADGSDAQLQTRNLLLTDSAEIDAQPVLEIHADEVKASHGATIGQLDDAALFYLRSRGLPEADARRLLVYAFCRSLLEDVSQDTLRERLEALVKRSLFNDDEAVA